MKRILIVEDDQILAKIYRNKFQQAQFSVETAADGQCALDMLAASPPDIILLDLMLPKVNGVDILKTVRSDTVNQAIPVVVFTNAYSDSLIQEAWDAGATKCLTKANYTPKQVVEIVRDLVQNPQAAASPASPPSFAPPTSVLPALFPPPTTANAPRPLFPPSIGSPIPALVGPVVSGPPPMRFHTPSPPPAIEPAKDESPGIDDFAIPDDVLPDWTEQIVDETPESPAASDSSAMDPDAKFQRDLRQTISEQAVQTLERLHELYRLAFNAPDISHRQTALFDFHRKMRSLANDAALANANGLTKLTAALESLAKSLYDKPAQFNVSTQTTLNQSLALLDRLLPRLAQPEPQGLLDGSVLIIDSDKLTQRALVLAVNRSELKVVTLDDAEKGLQKLAEGPQDLVILDSDINGMSGSELQRQIRNLPGHSETPVILVVMLQDLPAQMSAPPAPYDDLIAKPIQFAELSLKCLVRVLDQNLGISGWD